MQRNMRTSPSTFTASYSKYPAHSGRIPAFSPGFSLNTRSNQRIAHVTVVEEIAVGWNRRPDLKLEFNSHSVDR